MPSSAESLVEVSPTDMAGWSSRPPLTYRLADAWSRYAPRGKGYVPRVIGRRFGRGWRLTIRTTAGQQLAVVPAQLDVFTSINRTGSWEEHVLQACTAALKPGQVFYDIGANVGYMTICLAARMPDIQVVAFEPQPALAKAVAVSAALNRLGNVRVYATLVGEQPGHMDLFVPSHGVHASVVSRDHAAEAVKCPVINLDQEVAAGRLPAPDVIKLDVEGAEWQVLKGATDLLRTRTPTVIFESDSNSLRFGYQREDLLRWLSEVARYQFFRVSDSDILACSAAHAAEFQTQYPKLVSTSAAV